MSISMRGTPRARRGLDVGLDGVCATPEVFGFLDAEPRIDYVVATAKNVVLQRHAESVMQSARAQSEATGETERVYRRHPLHRPQVGP